MRKPVADYRGLRICKLTQPAYRHLLLLLGWPGYFLLYFLTENLIPWESCHVIHCALDDRIPFCEFFVIFYVGWYLLIALSLGYLLMYHIEGFKHLQTYIILVQILATVVYILYPSRQELRPEMLPRENFLTEVMEILYQIDTPTGILPSLHVAISVGIAAAWLREKTVHIWVRTAIVLFCAGVCMSVAFVKQHSVLDIVAAIPVCIFAYWMTFGRKFCKREA